MSCKCGRGSCAGNCAGNASKFSNPTKPFKRVKDRRGSPIRGLWKRGRKYYGRIIIKQPGKPGVDKRVGLDAGTVSEAKAELQRLRSNPPAGGGHKEIVELLIAAGADVNTKGYKGSTPLDDAIGTRRRILHPKTSDLLRTHGGKTGEELKAEGK